MSRFILLLFALALLVAGVLGTEPRLLFFWPTAFLLGIVGLLTALRGKVRLQSIPSDVCLGVATLSFGYFAIRAGLSPVADYAREDWVMVCAAFVAYVTMVTTASHPRWRLGWLVLLLVLAIGNLVVGAIHFSGDWSFHVVPQFMRAFDAGRIGGFFNNPNHLAAFFAMVVFVSLGWICFGRGGASLKLVLAFLVIASMLGMALTVSRGGIVALGVGMGFFAVVSFLLLWRTQRHLVGRLGVGALMLILLLGAVLWKVNEDYLRRRVAAQDSTEDVRFSIWRAALLQHAEQPWVGAGARMFYDGDIRYRQPDLPSWIGEAEFAHNEYVQVMADYGWVGLGLLGLTLLVHGWNGLAYLKWFAREAFPQTGSLLSTRVALVMGGMSALVASAVHAVAEFHWHVGIISLIGASLLGVLANPGFDKAAVMGRRLPGVRKAVKWGLAGAGGCLVYAGWVFGQADWAAAQAEIALGKNEPAEAVAGLEAAAERDPNSARIARRLGEVRLALIASLQDVKQRAALLEPTREALQRAADLNPFHYLTATTLADLHMVLGDPDAALREIHRALALAPLHEEPRLALALFYHRQQRFEEAERAYLWASRSQAANAESINWLAGYQMLLQNAEAAAKVGK
jgi:O-antigen ligase